MRVFRPVPQQLVLEQQMHDPDLQGIGNSARGLYISNGMILYDNAINGNHYIGTSMNGLMAGPVSVNGVLNVDGNFVVV